MGRERTNCILLWIWTKTQIQNFLFSFFNIARLNLMFLLCIWQLKKRAYSLKTENIFCADREWSISTIWSELDNTQATKPCYRMLYSSLAAVLTELFLQFSLDNIYIFPPW